MPSDVERRRAAVEAFLPALYEELRRVAWRYIRRQPPGFTLSATEIVHEACLHLLQHGRGEWETAEHFRAVAVRKIWQVIVDHLKRRSAVKRGGPVRAPGSGGCPLTRADQAAQARTACWRRVPLESVTTAWNGQPVDLLDLDEAIQELGRVHSRLREVVMLHWFGGMSCDAVGRYLGVSPSTVEKDFRYALAWLGRRLSGAREKNASRFSPAHPGSS
jgi:RNA polymerase sigma factor (sigma-70 family)